MLAGMPFDLKLHWSLEEPGLVATFTPGPDHHGPADSLHGGIAALLLDETMAAYGHAVDKVHMITGSLTIRYRKPIPLDGRPIRIEAWREGPLRRAIKVNGRIVTADGVVAVEANGLFLKAWDGAYPAKAGPDDAG